MKEERLIKLADGRIVTMEQFYAEMNERKRKRSHELAALPTEVKLNMLGAMWKVLRDYEASLVKSEEPEDNPTPKSEKE